MELWWNSSLAGLSRKDQRWMAAVLIYIAWGIWKERNCRVFNGVTALPSRVFQLILEEMRLRKAACGDLDLAWL
jgi:hypothetical protein